MIAVKEGLGTDQHLFILRARLPLRVDPAAPFADFRKRAWKVAAIAAIWLLYVMPVFAPVWAVSGDPAATRSPFSLRLSAPITSWDEAIPLGNGLTGGLLWGADHQIELSLDRGDLWDLRLPAMLKRRDWTYQTIRRLKAIGDQTTISRMFDEPYDESYPTKIPCARLELTFAPDTHARQFDLDLKQALGRVELGAGDIEVFFSAVEPVAMLRIHGAAPSYKLVRPSSLDKLGYPPAVQAADAHGAWLAQQGALGLKYAVVVGQQRVGDDTILAIAIASNSDGKDPLRIARERVHAALARGYATERAAHLAWWKSFWAISSVSIPDARLQLHYNLVKYFYGAASRANAPPMPLQGVWTADSDDLPPWKGDYHNDLNTEMTYFAYPTAGLFESGESFIDFNWRLLPSYRKFARRFYGVSGAVVPGVMTLTGQAIGGWSQYALSPTNGLWVGLVFYEHWRYTMDRHFLAERAYPWLAEVTEGIVALLKPDANGKLKLPLSSSPEIFDNSLRAWLLPNSNYDEALIGWAFDALAQMSEVLGKPAEAARWHKLHGQLAPLDVDPVSGALTFAKGVPYQESHREFSHAMAIYPLGTISIEGGDRQRHIIKATLQQLERIGTKHWEGYSFTWMAAMLARCGEPDRALRYLEDYERAFILRNGFHVNGDQTQSGLSEDTSRQFTLEANFLAMQAVQEMLLQSWGDAVRVFPAMPHAWHDAEFTNLRTEGGYRVSARRVAGKVEWLRVKSTVAGILRLRDNFGATPHWNRTDVVKRGNDFEVMLKRGEVLIGTMKY